MARGWESKSVEEQQSERGQPPSIGPRLTPAQAVVQRQLQALRLSRKSVEHDLLAASSPARLQMLQIALADLERRICEIESGSL